MTIELKQSLKLTQQLIMTPQLQQAIKLLQLSRIELADLVAQEMEQNPLLEEQLPDETDGKEDRQNELEGAGEQEIIRTKEVTGTGDGKEDFDWDSYLEDYGPVGVTYYREEGDLPPIENLMTRKETLTDYLCWQLNLSPLTEAEKRIGGQIIGNLDSGGYLLATMEEIAEIEKVDRALVERILKKVQDFDPPGVAARDLRECLVNQLVILGLNSPLIENILDGHMKDLETKNYLLIARKLKVSLKEVLAAVQVIINLDPRPGFVYSEEKPHYIIPDVFVFKVGDQYRIVLNDDGLPRIKLSNTYRDILSGAANGFRNEKNKDYIRERLQSATWLIKSIQQRQRTIYRVSESIVSQQQEFFDKGIQYLKPMVLKDIADDVEMHESTISRVTTNKYMHTPRGIFELKYFFNSGINRTDGDAIASESVREKIKEIVAREDPKKPLHDGQIVTLLEKSGISIARRTVAKYRELMGILPSLKRKKFF